jgi:hypothetical protein
VSTSTCRTPPDSLTYRVSPGTGLHAVLIDGARRNASVIHAVFEQATNEQWYRLRVDGWTEQRVPLLGSLPKMVADVLGHTPQELTDPDEAFLHALRPAPSESEDLLFILETITDGTLTAWRVLYTPKRSHQYGPGAALFATLLDPITGL